MTNVLSDSIQQLPALGLAEFRIAVLVVLLVAAAVIDYRTMKIPNWLTVGGVVTGLVLGTVDALRPLDGFLAALGGAGAGLVLLLPLYLLRVMGAGDVKLMAMAGAFLGVGGTLSAVLFTFVVGGIAALAFALWHRAFGRMAGNVRDIVQWMVFAAFAGLRPLPRVTAASSIGKLPYGISICAGTIAYLVARQLVSA
jgi:prepilin peptidase CpaA